MRPIQSEQPISSAATRQVSRKQNDVVEPAATNNDHVKTPTNVAGDKLTQIAKRFGLLSTGKKDITVEQRAERRKRINAARKQQNLETILEFAQSYMDNANVAEDVDPDWLYAFFCMAEEIFSSHMQALWGKILAAQVSRPNAFSMKTLHTLKQMTMRDAIALQHAVELTVRDKSEYGGRIISGYGRPGAFFGLLGGPNRNGINLSQHGLSYPNLLTLIDLNLIYSTEIETGQFNAGQEIELETYGKRMLLRCNVNGAVLQYYKYTQIGNELAKLIKVEPRDSYFAALKQSLAPVFNLTI
ncbi:TIGR03899 family protein [Saccharobesus litoralis]|uniref:TIGR03899 family protein n=1 Tax=Saccharobesus litoralis TaxID=2172099 RepID=A0A2S0VVW7_9ALTE|nr:TIGR03899 family protein [Saccharobesus litoralis]AWB68359.1 TIGR03899 family protein [Saccharobesus litoralis]